MSTPIYDSLGEDDLSLRWLQANSIGGSVGRTILTILYLIVLGFCFVVPFFYYARMRCMERTLRQGMGVGGTTSEAEDVASREERRAMRRKYRENKRALLRQLFEPVQTKLTTGHFSHLRATGPVKESIEKTGLVVSLGTNDDPSPLEDEVPDRISTADSQVESENDEMDVELAELGAASSVREETLRLESTESNYDDPHAEETRFVELPGPGLRFLGDPLGKEPGLRWVPNLCAICLASYDVGDEIVWSSNPSCEHAFHSKCILQWLMRQRVGSLCPCCRSDFVIDQYDLEEDFSLATLSNADAGGRGTAVSAVDSRERSLANLQHADADESGTVTSAVDSHES